MKIKKVKDKNQKHCLYFLTNSFFREIEPLLLILNNLTQRLYSPDAKLTASYSMCYAFATTRNPTYPDRCYYFTCAAWCCPVISTCNYV